MFLAWNEIKYSKMRYILIVGVVVLVSYLVFFLTGLAYGLAQANRTSVDKWNADAIVLTDESNTNINMSMISVDLQDSVNAEETAVLGQAAAVVRKKGKTGEDAKINATFFGIRSDEFIMPNVTEGEPFVNENEVVADDSLQDEGLEVGDILRLAGSDMEVTITGFTENAQFNVAPVLYTTVETYQNIRFSKTGPDEEDRVNAIIVRAKDEDISSVKLSDDDLRVYSIKDYIFKIPGYSAQVLTFGLMIGFLIVIAAIVIGIFIYVLTIQKTSLFGIMKAQGISSGYIAMSVLSQTFLLSAIGVAIGLLLTIGTSFVLPSAVPYTTNPLFLGIITFLLIVFAVLGALFSVRTVVKIDPLEAIG